ncbi:hypothetical protein [Aeromicrobium sp. UC242_57]|uniref:hypothetical protein n=1 Tax=Aeromicrobium sp. UC242_57 TaxID=3374624 RepID=UPI0037917BF2
MHQHLHGFLAEGDMAGLLTPHESARLSDGRNSGRHFLDVLTFDQLVVCLPRFVEPPWLMAPPADARAPDRVGRSAHQVARRLRSPGRRRMLVPREASAAVRKAQQRRGRGSRSPADESRARLTLLQGGLADR